MDNYTTYKRTRNGKEQTVTRVVYGHGLSHKERLYKIWQGMKRRCNEPTAANYRWYGGKGVKVCGEWQLSYLTFREWSLENGYAEGLELDRKDSDKDYEASNCRWITKKRNLRTRDLFWSEELDGQLINYAKEKGMNPYEVIAEAVASYLRGVMV